MDPGLGSRIQRELSPRVRFLARDNRRMVRSAGSALVLAGGGITGIAWESGVLAGLAAGGVDTRQWDLVIGTSAGAFVGARLLGDGSPDPLFAAQTSGNDRAMESALERLLGSGFVRVMRLSRRGRLRWVGLIWLANLIVTSLMRYAIRHGIRSTIAMARSLRPGGEGDPQIIAARIGAVANMKRTGSADPSAFWEAELGPIREWPSTRLVVVAVDTADGSRMAFEASSGVSLADAVAASTCLPGLLEPVELAGRRYMDGGLASAANADLATGRRDVWIVSPFGPASLDRQAADLLSSGSIVHLIRPGAAAERALGPGIGVMDPSRRSAAARAGFADGQMAAKATRPPRCPRRERLRQQTALRPRAPA
jgi:NTE family protein